MSRPQSTICLTKKLILLREVAHLEAQAARTVVIEGEEASKEAAVVASAEEVKDKAAST